MSRPHAEPAIHPFHLRNAVHYLPAMCGTRVGPVERVAARLRLIFRHDPTCKSILQSTNYGLALRDERHEEKILAARSLRVDASLGDVVASRIFIGHGPRTLPDKTIPWFGDSKLSSAGGEDVGAARRLDVIPGVFRAGLRLIGDLNSIWRVSFWRGRDFQQWREGCGRSSCLCPARRDSGLAGL